MKLRSGNKTLSSGNKRRRATAGSDPVEPRPWSSIPSDVLSMIAGKISSVDDFVRFCATCRSWYSIATDLYNTNRQELNFGPLLLLTPHKGPESENRAVLRNPSSGAALTLDLPAPTETIRWGSPFGWLITLDKRAVFQFGLLNPFTGATIALPSLPLRSARHPINAFLTASPESDPENFLVVVSFLGPDDAFNLVFSGPNSSSWWHVEGGVNLCSVASFRGELYGITIRGNDHYGRGTPVLVSLQLNREHNGRISPRAVETLTLEISNYNEELVTGRQIVDRDIVEVCGDLCLCVRYPSSGFKIFRIDIPGRSVTRIVSLSGHCLFLSENHSFACKASYSSVDEVFDEDRNEASECARSNYVFYSRNVEYVDVMKRFEVWDVSSSKLVYWSRRYNLFQRWLESMWIVPSLRLRKLEELALTE